MPSLIAIIDDDKTYQFFIKKIMANSGHAAQLVQLYDGQEALNYFKENENDESKLPDLILLDINMPYIDGWQFLDQLALLNPAKKNMSIYMVTSSSSAIDMQKAATYKNVSGYHLKPVTKDKFTELLNLVP